MSGRAVLSISPLRESTAVRDAHGVAGCCRSTLSFVVPTSSLHSTPLRMLMHNIAGFSLGS